MKEEFYGLRQLFNEAEHPSDKWEHYFGIYEKHLAWTGFVSYPLTLVEVGVQKGGSLDMWGKFLGPHARIIGIDVDPECAKLKYTNPNIKVVIGDQGDPAFWDSFLAEHTDIDIFIDDGGHFMDQQILTFEKVFPVLGGYRNRGFYFCEDCHTSYMGYNGGSLKQKSSFIGYSKSLVDCIHRNYWEEMDAELDARNKLVKDLTSVHFYDSIVVFEKLGKSEIKRVCPKAYTPGNQ